MAGQARPPQGSGDEYAAEAAVAVAVEMDRLELGMQDRRVGVRVEVGSLIRERDEIVAEVRYLVWRRRNVGGPERRAAADALS